jgi:cyclic pyranopterin phosphate synthase
MPEEGVSKLDHGDILTDEEILRIVRLFVDMGISSVRVTGGEPLIRHNIMDLLGSLSEVNGITDLSLTTNGVRLDSDTASFLASVGMRVNISLDTFNPDVYSNITRGGDLSSVFKGLDSALSAGIDPVKINVVVLQGVNDREIPDFIEMARQRPVHVRFIEHMPVIERNMNHSGALRSGIMELLHAPVPVMDLNGKGPAQVFREAEMAGSIGVIDPVSRHFCAGCNRVRLHSNGDLSYCLFSDAFLNLRDLLRRGVSDSEIMERINEFVSEKPLTHSGLFTRTRPMSSVGG